MSRGSAGLDVEMYGMGVAVGDYNNDGFPDLFISCVGQSRLFENTGKGTFVDVTERSGLAGRSGFSTSALWFDYDRDGLLDLFVCNYVKWSPEQNVHCSLDGKRQSYCTPEAYRGSTCWLFRNRGGGRFEDVTAKAACSIRAPNRWASRCSITTWTAGRICSSPTTRSRTSSTATSANGTFEEVAVRAGVAFSEDGKARAGMGVDAGDFDNSGALGLAVTNFDNEMMGLYHSAAGGMYTDQALQSEIGR